MEKMIQVASYIAQRYEKEFHETIDQMKLHKLMYFTQRESFIQQGKPLFKDNFEAWKYGPVLPKLRGIYNKHKEILFSDNKLKIEPDFLNILDSVFKYYASKNSWSLVKLTHNEISWQQARIGVPVNETSHNKLSNDNIKRDAERIKFRRLVFDF